MAEPKRHRDVPERVLESSLSSAHAPESKIKVHGNRFEQSREGPKQRRKA